MMLTSIGIIIISAILLGRICDIVRLPRLVAMLLIGVVFGPFVLDIISGELLAVSQELRNMALVIILTRSGLSLSISELKKVGRPAVLMSFLPATFEICGYVIFGTLILNISVVDALLIGAVMAAVSPAVVVPRMIKIKEEGYGEKNGVTSVVMAASSVDDVYVIVLFSAFLALSASGEFAIATLLTVPISIIIGIAVGVICGIAFSAIFQKIHMRDSIKVLLILSLSFILLGLEDAVESIVPFSALIAIVTIGVLIATRQPERAVRLSSKFTKLWIFAEIMLFVLVGAIVDISYASQNALPVIAVIALAMCFRMLGAFLATAKSHLTTKERLFCMISFTPKATVQAAIGGAALSAGLAIGNLALSFAVIGILLSAPIGAVLIDFSYKKLLDKS
ncbi:MAG: cation:proton antiporter [Bacillota bacterium]